MISKQHREKIRPLLIMVLICLELFPVSFTSFAEVQNDSTLIHQQHQIERDAELEDDFSPGLFFLALTGLVLIIVSTVLFCALVLSGVLFLFALIAGGVVSISIVYGMHRKSLEEGFRAFCVLFFTVSGLLGVSLVFYLFNRVTHWWELSTTLIAGGISGLIAGYFAGRLMFIAITRLIIKFKNWYEKRNPDYFSNS